MNMQCSCCNSVDQAGAQLGFGSEESVDSQCLRSFGSGRNCQGFARIFFVPRLQNFYQRTTYWVMPRMEACDLLSSERSMVLETPVQISWQDNFLVQDGSLWAFTFPTVQENAGRTSWPFRFPMTWWKLLIVIHAYTIYTGIRYTQFLDKP